MKKTKRAPHRATAASSAAVAPPKTIDRILDKLALVEAMIGNVEKSVSLLVGEGTEYAAPPSDPDGFLQLIEETVAKAYDRLQCVDAQLRSAV